MKRRSQSFFITYWFDGILFGTLIAICLYTFGGIEQVTKFSVHSQHRWVAYALLHGELSYPRPLWAGFPIGDMEVHDGAMFSHWGYGVALLQLPFQGMAQSVSFLGKQGFFPDRAVFFFYLCMGVVICFLALSKAFRCVLDISSSWASLLAGVVVAYMFLSSILWLFPHDFLIYSETMAYFAVFQLSALACYCWYLGENSRLAPFACGALAAMGLLIRPTGVPYAFLWAVCFYLARRDVKAVLRYCVFVLPGAAFWLLTNRARTGGFFSMGFENSIPNVLSSDLFPLRFGSPCSKSVAGAWEVFRQIFFSLFLSNRPLSSFLAGCRFEVEGSERVPFLGPWILVFCLLILAFQFYRRQRLWLSIAPVLLILCLLVEFARAGIGFSDRYLIDFAPALSLLCVQGLVFNRLVSRKFLVGICGALLVASAWKLFGGDFRKYSTSSVIGSARLEPAEEYPERVFDERFRNTRVPDSFPSSAECRHRCYPLESNCFGWKADCRVSEVTNFFLGVPPKKESATYRLAITVDAPVASSLRVFINGRYYSAYWTGEKYLADFPLDISRFSSPNILVDIKWAPSFSDASLFHLWKVEIL